MVINTVAKTLFFSTVCLEGSDKQGAYSAGTGFVLSHEFPDYGEEIFIVTNKHVVAPLEKAKLCFTRRVGQQPVIGHTFAFDCQAGFGSAFHGHPDPGVDIALLPVSYLLKNATSVDRDAFVMSTSTRSIPSKEDWEDLDAILPVLFVGYPNGMYDKTNMTPIVRRGISATPVQLDYDGEPVFLIDASVFPGSSGSPVFTFSETWEGGITNLRLLGIIAKVFTQQDSGELQLTPIPTEINIRIAISQKIDLGLVFKSHLIMETIEDCWKVKGNELRRVNKKH
jgi:hypothetical protein